jgi:hypothetical protein
MSIIVQVTKEFQLDSVVFNRWDKEHTVKIGHRNLSDIHRDQRLLVWVGVTGGTKVLANTDSSGSLWDSYFSDGMYFSPMNDFVGEKVTVMKKVVPSDNDGLRINLDDVSDDMKKYVFGKESKDPRSKIYSKVLR